jgi:CBS domain-containing protein
MEVRSVMTKDVATCVKDETLNQAVRIMLERDCGVVPILENRGGRKVAGVLTDRDVCIAAHTKGQSLEQIPIGDVMARRVVSCLASDELESAEQTMKQAQVHRLPVLDEYGQLVGMLSIGDIARATARGAQGNVTPIEVGETIAAIRQPRALEAGQAK